MLRQLYFICWCAVMVCSLAAPPGPASPAQYYPRQPHPLEYYIDNPGPAYFNNLQQKQVSENNNHPARLENLEPDSEVELLPGAQAPQPPQQAPVYPNVPGLLPGQRVFIIHPMSILPNAYRPGVPTGYQPVYVVAAQGNYAGSPQPGYQSTLLVDPTVHAAGGCGAGRPCHNPFQLSYPTFPGFALQNAPGASGAVHLAQLVPVQTAAAANKPLGPAQNIAEKLNSQQLRLESAAESNESEEMSPPAAAHAAHAAHAARPAQLRSKPKP